MRKLLPTVLAILSAGAATATAQTLISTFSGGDPGEGLQLQGTFLPGYAVYAGAGGETATYQIQNAVFENSLVAGGFEIFAPNETPFGTPTYGGTTNDLNLSRITDFVRFGGAGSPSGTTGVLITAPVTVGTQYRLQLLFNEACCANRGFDVFADNSLVTMNFNPSVVQGGVNNINTLPGALITYTFTATEPTLDVELRVSNPPFGDNNAIIDAVSLEVVPEPGTAILAAMSGAGLLALRRRRR